MNGGNSMERFECQDVTALFSGLMDDELDPETRHMAEAHMVQCASCRSRLNKAEELDFLTRDFLADSAGDVNACVDRLQDRVRAAIGLSHASAVREGRRRLSVLAWTGWSTALAASAVIAFLLVRDQTVSPTSGSLTLNNATPGAVDPTDGMKEADRQQNSGNFLAAAGDRLGTPLDVTDGSRQALSERQSSVRLASALPPGVLASRSLHRPPFVVVRVGRSPQSIASTHAASEFVREAAAQSRMTDHSAIPSWFPVARVGATQGQVNSSATPAMLTFSEPVGDPMGSLLGAGDLIHQAAIVLHVVKAPDVTIDGDLEGIQQAIAIDDLLERVASLSGHVSSDEDRRLVRELWSTLEWINSTRDSAELDAIRARLRQTELAKRAADLSDRMVIR